MKTSFSKAEYQQAKAFLKDATLLSEFSTPTLCTKQWRKPDGSIWSESESRLEAPEDDYSLAQTSKATRDAHPEQRPTAPQGTVYSRHIEEPKAPFFVWVHRSPGFNVFFRPGRWEMWRVLAQTAEGAVRIARYHFFSASEIQFYGGILT